MFKEIKEEIKFFMDKSFQVSFFYTAALVAYALGLRAELVKQIATATNLDGRVVLVLILLISNFVYLTISLSCSFAVIKRGLFILQFESREPDNVLAEWERYIRIGPSRFGFISWNIDNLYVGVVMALVFLLSFSGLVFALTILCSQSAMPYRDLQLWLCSAAIALHAVPLWAMAHLLRIMSVHRQRL
jgi:hypothetical protein